MSRIPRKQVRIYSAIRRREQRALTYLNVLSARRRHARQRTKANTYIDRAATLGYGVSMA